MSHGGHESSGDTAALRPLGAAEPTAASLTVVVFSDTGAMTARRLTRTLSVGRDPSCDLMLDDQGASREHLRLAPLGDLVEIVDCGSRNGTLVDGARISRVAVRPPVLVRVGDTLLRVVRLAEEWQPAAAIGPLVGGTALAPVRRLVSLVGPTELPVLILGETGTGKEVAARLLHAASGRTGPFVAVNCAALPEALVESELFGHAPGAFTGASRGRKGLFATASGGTLLLDEVGDLPLPAQAKLLRVLEDGLVRPVGAETPLKVDVRVMSATNRDLARSIADGRFRADLAARLGAVEIRMPALRERPEDLRALCTYLLGRAAGGSLRLDGHAFEAMALYDWPQNVRELDNLLRSAALGGRSLLLFEELPERIQAALTRARSRRQAGEARASGDDRKTEVEEALRLYGGNVRQASRALGIARSHVYRLLRSWDLDPDAYRPRATDEDRA